MHATGSERGACEADQYTWHLHLEAEMVSKHLEGWDLAGLDYLFIENVGNLGCRRVTTLGSRCGGAAECYRRGDKPLKYPRCSIRPMRRDYQVRLAGPCEFDREAALKNIRAIRPGIRVFETSAENGCWDGGMAGVSQGDEGVGAVDAYLAKVPEPARSTLEKIRAAIRSVVPAEATEA